MWTDTVAFRQNSQIQAYAWLVLNVSTPCFPSPPPTRLFNVERFSFPVFQDTLSLKTEAALHSDTPPEGKTS